MVHRNGALPNIVENQYRRYWPKTGRPYPIPVKTTTGISLVKWNVPHWSGNIKRLAINLDTASSVPEPRTKTYESMEQNLWNKLKLMFPKLEQLDIVLYSNPKRNHELHDITELAEGAGSSIQKVLMQNVQNNLDAQRAKGEFDSLRVRFVRRMGQDRVGEELIFADHWKRFETVHGGAQDERGDANYEADQMDEGGGGVAKDSQATHNPAHKNTQCQSNHDQIDSRKYRMFAEMERGVAAKAENEQKMNTTRV